MKTVYIVGRDPLINDMFRRQGWKIVNDAEDADYIQFTGGADVDPMLYGEPRHPSTHSDPVRDSRESNIYHTYWGHKKFLGICRGGQFLNVMSGGLMWQNVDKHAISGVHDAYDVDTAETFPVTSTHHQMMIEGETGRVLLYAGRSTRKEGGYEDFDCDPSTREDVEAVLYEKSQTLCFQPHPEYVDADHPCQQLYFYYINKYLGD